MGPQGIVAAIMTLKAMSFLKATSLKSMTHSDELVSHAIGYYTFFEDAAPSMGHAIPPSE